MRWGIALTFLLVAACDAGGLTLLVELKTDFVPGNEFIAVRTELFRGPLEGGTRRQRVDHPAFFGTDYAAGARVAELGPLEAGPWLVRAVLVDREGRELASRPVLVDLQNDRSVTLLVGRSCAGVSCPGAADDPSFSACLGGRCVDPRCTPETPETCPAPTCSLDGECPARGCAEGRCVDGLCLAIAAPGACPSDAWCDPDRGCVPLVAEPAPDAGPPDAGPPPIDAGPPPSDAGPSCGFARCRADGEPCGTCGDASGGAMVLDVDGTLAGGVYEVESFTIAADVTIQVTGTAPLRILSRGPVIIAGTLDLAGRDGAGVECSNGPPRAGGVGGAGGYAGGQSGVSNTGGADSSRNGVAGGGPGGGVGGQGGSASGGGGGGGSASAGSASTDGVCIVGCGCGDTVTPGGPGGAAFEAFGATSGIFGGSGGGGAGWATNDNARGGAGGGGGGALLVIAPSIQITGAIAAHGGTGGGAAPCDGGTGGGGAGGSVWLRATSVELTGTIDLRGGPGGAPVFPCNRPGVGGAGADGQLRIDALDPIGVPAEAIRGELLCDGPPCD